MEGSAGPDLGAGFLWGAEAVAPPQQPPDARPPIRVLPPAAVARIAAGEIVERPASVVKELVENALDAGARRVRVDVRGGGLGLIRVGDDGCGIPPEELRLACERHATSKLRGDDVGDVRTLGFRGEALPSIAAVAELSIVCASDEGGVGGRLTLLDGAVVEDGPAPRPRGTTVTVRHLFGNVPARLASAGRPQAEIAQIGQVLRRLAVAAPRVRLELVVDDRPMWGTSGSGELSETLVEAYGARLEGSLLPLGPVEAAGARVWGVVSGPEVTRPGRGQVNVVVNGRWVQPRGLIALLEAAYRPLLPRGRHPVLALCIEAPPDQVDVNIHPSKLEVRLLEEKAIGAAAGELIRAALGNRPIAFAEPFATGLEALGGPPSPSLGEARAAWDEEEEPIATPGLPPLRLVGQVRDRLLLLEGEAGLYLVDQHRAHERILYERLARTHGGGGPEPVALPEPLVIELSPAQVARFGRRLDELAALGFECEAFGGRTFLLRSAPILPGVLSRVPSAAGDEWGEEPRAPGPDGAGQPTVWGEPGELAGALLGLADEEAGEGERWKERLLVRLACRTAVRRGRPLPRPAMRFLVEGLGNTSAPAVCPHGSPLLMHIGGSLLERQFGWG